MAKVICSPNISSHCCRKLPVGKSPAALESGGPAGHRPAKGGAVTPVPREQEALDVKQLMVERDAALERAAAAEAQLSKIHSQLEDCKSKARESGYQDGFRQGAAKAAEEQAAATEALKELINTVSDQRHELVQAGEDAAVEIGFAAAAKMFGKINVDHHLLTAMVKEAMRKVNERDGLVVCLSAEDCRRMLRIKAQSTNGDQWSKIEFVTDEQVGLGGCIIRTRAGSLEARLEYQLKALKKCLLEAHEKGAEENLS